MTFAHWTHYVLPPIGGTVAFLLGHEVGVRVGSINPVTSGSWCAVAAMVLVHGELSEARKAAVQRFVGTLIGAASACVALLFLPHGALTVGACVFAATFVCVVQGRILAAMAASITAIVVLSAVWQHPQIDPVHTAGTRVLEVVLGVSLGFLLVLMASATDARLKAIETPKS